MKLEILTAKNAESLFSKMRGIEHASWKDGQSSFNPVYSFGLHGMWYEVSFSRDVNQMTIYTECNGTPVLVFAFDTFEIVPASEQGFSLQAVFRRGGMYVGRVYLVRNHESKGE